MRHSQAEMKAIEAELQSIRANKALPQGQSVTLLEPDAFRVETQPISPTIVSSVVKSPTAKSSTAAKPTSSSTKRSIECFPFPQPQTQQSHSQRQAAKQQRRRSDQMMQQFKQVESQFLSDVSDQRRESLETLLMQKADQLNQLANQQEAMILELMSLSEKLEQDLQSIKPDQAQTAYLFCESETTEIPYIETDIDGTLILTTRSLQPQSAESEAATIARSLRSRGRNHNWIGSAGRFLWRLIWGSVKLVGTLSFTIAAMITAPIGWLFSAQQTVDPPRRKTYRGSGRRAADAGFSLTQAALLIVGSALLRMSLDWLVASHPVLWVPSILIMITPAAIATYRSTAVPQSGFVWGYRLFAILIGLLLGGRL